MCAVPATQQRANPLTKVIRSPSAHWRESEWLQGTSSKLTDMQEEAKEDGIKKKGFREEIEYISQLVVAWRNLCDWKKS